MPARKTLRIQRSPSISVAAWQRMLRPKTPGVSFHALDPRPGAGGRRRICDRLIPGRHTSCSKQRVLWNSTSKRSATLKVCQTALRGETERFGRKRERRKRRRRMFKKRVQDRICLARVGRKVLTMETDGKTLNLPNKYRQKRRVVRASDACSFSPCLSSDTSSRRRIPAQQYFSPVPYSSCAGSHKAQVSPNCFHDSPTLVFTSPPRLCAPARARTCAVCCFHDKCKRARCMLLLALQSPSRTPETRRGRLDRYCSRAAVDKSA
jgi:hypothetical protein